MQNSISIIKKNHEIELTDVIKKQNGALIIQRSVRDKELIKRALRDMEAGRQENFSRETIETFYKDLVNSELTTLDIVKKLDNVKKRTDINYKIKISDILETSSSINVDLYNLRNEEAYKQLAELKSQIALIPDCSKCKPVCGDEIKIKDETRKELLIRMLDDIDKKFTGSLKFTLIKFIKKFI